MKHYLRTAVGGIALLTGATAPVASPAQQNSGRVVSISAQAGEQGRPIAIISPYPPLSAFNAGNDERRLSERIGIALSLLLSWVTYQVTPAVPGYRGHAAAVAAEDGSSELPAELLARGSGAPEPEPTRVALLTLGMRG